MFTVKQLKRAVMFLGLLAGASHAPAARAEITVTDGFLLTQARETTISAVNVLEDTVPLPYSAVHTAIDGPTVAQSVYDFRREEGFAYFDFGFAYTRGGGELSRADSAGDIEFILDEPFQYSIAGSFTQSGTGRISLYVHLRDLSVYGGQTVYAGIHESAYTPDESFTLGVPGGDILSVVVQREMDHRPF